MTPIIYNISNDRNHLQTSLESLLKSNLNNAELVLFDNYNENVEDYIYSENLPVNIIQPLEKIEESEILKYLLVLSFSLFQSSSHSMILNNDFIFKKDWFTFMNYLFTNEMSENIGIGSVFNPTPLNNIDKEPFLFESNISLDSFMISRRMFNKLKEDGFLEKNKLFRMCKFNFISKITSYSYMKLIDVDCERYDYEEKITNQ